MYIVISILNNHGIWSELHLRVCAGLIEAAPDDGAHNVRQPGQLPL